MDQYTFKVSRCDWDCLTRALMNRCDLGSRKLPTCQQASLMCDDAGGCDVQCDDTTKPNMPPIENDGLKTFLKEKKILCRRAEALVITSRCEECDIELKTMRLRLPKKRERLACGTVQEMLDQNLIQFDCIYKVCDCQEEDNRLIANCKFTNIETNNKGNENENVEEDPQDPPEATTTALYVTPQNMKKGKRTKSPKNKENVSTTASTTSKVSSTTTTGKKKGKGQNSSQTDDECESEHLETTTSSPKKEKKKKKGKNNNENTTSMSLTSPNDREQTSRGNNQVTAAVEPGSTTSGQKKKKGKDTRESTTSSFTGRQRRRKGYGRQCHVYENGTVTSGTTTIVSQTAVHRGSGGNSEETTNDLVDAVSSVTIKEPSSRIDTTTDQTSADGTTTEIENETTSDYFDYTGNSTERWTNYTDGLDSVNGSAQRKGIYLETSTTVRPDTVTLQRSGLPMHQTPVFSYALAGGVAGIVLILLVVLCIALFDKDRKRKIKQRKFLDSMNLPPPPSELRNGRSSSKRKSSVRFSATLSSMNDQIRSPTKMNSFSLKKTDLPDTNSV